ncbi:MAG TPA: helix-turn-helix transcriptional regulator [Solirubrobacteraceae bacterium]|nr:helix-turn-helix transcriptional regulator [Solirubrobacteraceae bacterium]
MALAGRFTEALAAIDRTLELARERGDEMQFGLGSMTRTWIALRAGRVREAEADARAALDAGPPGFVDARHATGNLIGALIERGELDLADAELVEQGFAQTHERGAMSGAILFALRGRLSLVRGRPRDALADLRICAEMLLAAGMASPGFADWRRDTALAQLALGDVDAARRVAAEDLELSRAFGAPRELGIALRTTGLIAGDRRGLELLAESIAVLAPSEARLEHAYSLVEYGAALRRSGRRRQAREHLARGLDAASRCGARATAERARAELLAAGAKPRRERLSGLDSLTASELRVARLAAEGHGNREIAQALFVTRRTVEVHLTSVYRKLDIASREQLPGALQAEGEHA